MFDDLRGFIHKLEQKGQVTKVEGADWELEIGTINELMVERKKPIVLFDKIKGYPQGYRLVTNVFRTGIALRIGLGIPEQLSDVEVIRYWKDVCDQYKPVPPVEVDSGPVMENVLNGEQIDIFRFPAPRWHEGDGGRYIGTGNVIVTRETWRSHAGKVLGQGTELPCSHLLRPGAAAVCRRLSQCALGCLRVRLRRVHPRSAH